MDAVSLAYLGSRTVLMLAGLIIAERPSDSQRYISQSQRKIGENVEAGERGL